MYRGARIRTGDLTDPNGARYQAAPRPESSHCGTHWQLSWFRAELLPPLRRRQTAGRRTFRRDRPRKVMVICVRRGRAQYCHSCTDHYKEAGTDG